jgi:hypothetical protein
MKIPNDLEINEMSLNPNNITSIRIHEEDCGTILNEELCTCDPRIQYFVNGVEVDE